MTNTGLPQSDVDLTLDAEALARLRELDPDGRHGVVERVLNAFEMSLPKLVRRRLTDNASFTVLFTILPLLLNLVRSVRNVKAGKYCLEPGNILHLLSLRGKKATRRWPPIA